MFQEAFFKTKNKIDKLSEIATGKKIKSKPKEDSTKTSKNEDRKEPFRNTDIRKNNNFSDSRNKNGNFKHKQEKGRDRFELKRNQQSKGIFHKSGINKFNNKGHQQNKDESFNKKGINKFKSNDFTETFNPFKKQKKPRHRDRLKTNVSEISAEIKFESNEETVEKPQKKRKLTRIDEIKTTLKDGETSEELKQLYEEISKKRKEKLEKLDKIIVDGKEVKVVSFRDYRVTKTDADRLKKLKKELVKKGASQEEIQATLKLERKKAEQVVIDAVNIKPPKVKKVKEAKTNFANEETNDIFNNTTVKRVNNIVKFDD